MATLATDRTMAERIEQQACDRAADLLWNESMDDYAAAVVTMRADGAAVVKVAAEVNTWLALCLACERDVRRAGELAAMRIPDEWRMVDCPLFGRVQMRPIEDQTGNVVGFLFKR